MPDLVDRLRDEAMWRDDKVCAAMREAADEIERLREEVQTSFDKGYRAAGGEIIPLFQLHKFK